jgi:hypothetical protein
MCQTAGFSNRRLWRLAALLLCVFVPAVVSADDEERAAFLMGEMRKSRQRLVSGEFEAEVKYRRLVGATSREAQCRVLFADSVALLRHEESYVMRSAGEGELSQDVRFVFTPEKSLHATLGECPTVAIREPDAAVFGDAVPFDVRTIGLVSEFELREGFRGGSRYARTFESVFASFRDNYEVDEVAVQEDGTERIRFRLKRDNRIVKWLWIDPRQGYSPVRHEMNYGHYKPHRVEVQTQWSQLDGVWVPIKCEMVGHTHDTRMTIALDWKQVNQPVDPHVFTLEGLDLPPSADPDELWGVITPEVADERSGEYVILRRREYYSLLPEVVPPGDPWFGLIWHSVLPDGSGSACSPDRAISNGKAP